MHGDSTGRIPSAENHQTERKWELQRSHPDLPEAELQPVFAIAVFAVDQVVSGPLRWDSVLHCGDVELTTSHSVRSAATKRHHIPSCRTASTGIFGKFVNFGIT